MINSIGMAEALTAEELLYRVRRNVLNKNIEKKSNEPFVIDKQGLLILQNQNNQIIHKLANLQNSYYIHDSEITVYRTKLKFFIIPIKRLIRKMTFWFIKPYINQQITFNETAFTIIKEQINVQQKLIEHLINGSDKE